MAVYTNLQCTSTGMAQVEVQNHALGIMVGCWGFTSRQLSRDNALFVAAMTICNKCITSELTWPGVNHTDHGYTGTCYLNIMYNIF